MEPKPKARKCRVLLIYRRMIPSVRLCGHSQMQALSDLGLIEYRAAQDSRLTLDDMNWADTVLLGRSDNWYERQVAQRLHDAGRRLVYIIDDDLLNLPPTIQSAAYLGQPEIQDNIRAMMAMSDAILSPSPLLLEMYATDGRAAIRTEEPALEPVPYRPREADRPVKIGFAGSVDRSSDLEDILGDALMRVKRKYGDRVAFEFFGAVPAFAEDLEAESEPYLNSYDAYRRKLNALEWDIGLAPMPESHFHACKHYNKFCEYAAAGIAGIYTDCPPYTFIPERERFGRFCKNDPQAWFEQICAEVDDARGREAHRRCGSEYAAAALSPEAIGCALMEAHPEIFAPVDANPVALRGMFGLKLGNFAHQTAEKGRRYGWKLPFIVGRELFTRVRERFT